MSLMRKFVLACFIVLAFGVARGAVAQQSRGADVRTVTQLPSREKRWALLVGVSDYEDGNITDLNGAQDAKALKDALVQYAGFSESQIILLTTDQPKARQPTRDNILKHLSDLKRSVPSDGLLLFSFSGHGTERNDQAFLMPSTMFYDDDFETLRETAVSVEFIKRQIKSMKVMQVLILLDACRSEPLNSASDSINPLTEAYKRGFSFDVRNREVTAFATLYATSVGARAYEYAEKGLGYFTWAIIEGIKGGAANEHGEVTLYELKKFIEKLVPQEVRRRLGKTQQPTTVIEGYKDDELVLAVSRANSPAIQPGNTGDAAFYLTRAHDHFKLGNYDQAINDLNMAVQLDARNVEAYSSLCGVYTEKGEYNQAIITCNKALRLNPKFASAYNNLGTAYYGLRKYDEAIENLDMTIKLDATNARAYANRCASHLDRGDYDLAVRDCEKAIQINPEQTNAYGNLGTAYYRKGDSVRAIKNLETAIKLKSHSDTAYSSICAVYIDEGDMKRAITNCNKAIQLNPYNATASNNLGVAYYELKKYDDAIKNLTRAIELDSQDANAYFNLGMAYFSKDEYTQAIDYFTRAISINSRYVIAYKNRAEAYKKVGKQGLAQADLKKVEELEQPATRP